MPIACHAIGVYFEPSFVSYSWHLMTWLASKCVALLRGAQVVDGGFHGGAARRHPRGGHGKA
jgi:hypothetical protein